MSKFTKGFAALAAVAALAAGAAQAADAISVAYGDLDLSRPSDAAEFNTRVDKAAKKWCRQEPLRTGSRISDLADCKARAHAAAVAAMPKAKAASYLAALKQSDEALLAQRDASPRP
jgi:UrcA family protein